MFCAKCGREIRDDSVYCSYCGVRIPDVPEEAALSSGAEHHQPDTPCVQPGAPKKKCLDCGKELPSSTVSDICALCTIRRRNRELDEERERRDREEDLREERRDRYDISDEFDFSVFSQDQAHYFRGEETEDSQKRAKKAKTSRHSRSKGFNEPPKKRRTGCLIAIIVAVVLITTALPALFGVGIALFNSFSQPEWEVHIPAQEEAPVLAQEDEAESILPEEDWETMIPATPGDAVSQQELLDWFLIPELHYQLSNALEILYGQSNYEVWGPEILPQEAQITMAGSLTLYDENGSVLELPYQIQVYPFSSMVFTSYVELDGAVLYDDSALLSLDGTATSEGAQIFGTEEGEPLLGEPAIWWEDLPAE